MPGEALRSVQSAERMGSVWLFGCLVSIIMIITAIAALIIGAIFHGQCAIEPNISVYLIVEGTATTVVYLAMLIWVGPFLKHS